jgi:hypothetical protein
MRRLIYALLVAGLGLGATAAVAQSDAQIRQRLIRDSIASYPGSCPCPYSSDRAGRRCGGRSAYNRRGGYAPLCFPSDVSQSQVAAYRRTRR